jgi:PRTRC genetic system protein C
MELLNTTHLKRVFKLKKGTETITLPDPNPAFTQADVMQFYSNQYPELTTCTVDGPKIENDQVVYEFKTTVGTKG